MHFKLRVGIKEFLARTFSQNFIWSNIGSGRELSSSCIHSKYYKLGEWATIQQTQQFGNDYQFHELLVIK